MPLADQQPEMNWKKDKMLEWLNAHNYDGSHDLRSANKSDLISGPIAEVLSQTSKAE